MASIFAISHLVSPLFRVSYLIARDTFFLPKALQKSSGAESLPSCECIWRGYPSAAVVHGRKRRPLPPNGIVSDDDLELARHLGSSHRTILPWVVII
jgi:hypothetical protein